MILFVPVRSTIHMSNRSDRGVCYGVEQVMDYFYTAFPVRELDKNVEGTTDIAILFQQKSKQMTRARGDFVIYIGVRLVAAVLEKRRGAVRSWFKKGDVKGRAHQHGGYFKWFGMTATRFQVLNDCTLTMQIGGMRSVLSFIGAFIDVRLYVELGMRVMDTYLLFKSSGTTFGRQTGP